MTPTAFEFTVTMPGDDRLVSAIRHLTAHAAGYAQLDGAAGEELAREVQDASDVAVAAAAATIDYRFNGNAETLTVVVSFDARPGTATPATIASKAASVEWRADGPRHTCQIRQRLTA